MNSQKRGSFVLDFWPPLNTRCSSPSYMTRVAIWDGLK